MRFILAAIVIMAMGCAHNDKPRHPLENCIVYPDKVICPVEGVYTPIK